MICFRDMTFCPYWRDCAKADRCHRPLTDEVKKQAALWWGEGMAPICVYTDVPPCHVAMMEDKENAE